MRWRCVMKTEWLRKTIADFDPYFVAPIAEKHVINANENYLNVLTIPGVKEELIQALDTFRPQIYPKPMSDDIREALADHIGAKPENFIVGNGGDEMITYLLGTFLDPGDQILIHSPTFDMYELGAETLGASAIKVKDLPGYRRDQKGLLEAVRRYQPKVTVICNPNNPTGYLYSEEELQRLRDIVLSHDLYLFADEVYREFRYTDAPYLSALCLEGLEQNVVVIDSVSKRYSECGTRIGMIVSHNKEAILKFCQARLSPPLLGQIVAEASIEGTEEYSKECFDEYLARRDFFIAGLNKIPGVYSPMPNGAFYTIASLPVENAEDFCSWCLTDFSYKDDGTPEGYTGETVMMAPAAGFYSTPNLGKNQVRMAYVLKTEDLGRSLLVLEKALEAYKK